MVDMESDHINKSLRLLAAVLGVLSYISARGLGIFMPNLIFSSLETLHPIMFWLKSAILPFGAGTLIAWYVMKVMTKSQEQGVRVIILIMSFILVAYGDIYAASFNNEGAGEGFNKSLLPNLTFILALGFYAIFNFDKEKFRQESCSGR